MADCFKAYDVRGRVPEELNEDIAFRIGSAYADVIKPKKVVVGRDIRHTSGSLAAALSEGLMSRGVDVFDIGLCGTEEIYFSTFHFGMDGGIMVTASHNPIEYNGMKFVRKGSVPISGDTGLNDIKELVYSENMPVSNSERGTYNLLSHRDEYIKHLLGYIDADSLKGMTLAVNAGNGCAGVVIDELEKHLPCRFIKVHNEPDGSFPNGIPNPLLPENRKDTAAAVIKYKADMGIAWDGDFDRCFLFDEKGEFIEGYYIVAMLAEEMLKKNPGSSVIYDPRLYWNTVEVIKKAGGVPVMSKTGHAFIKERMRKEDAVYGGEMSAHHYFKNFAYCDSGMIPWLLVASLISSKGVNLFELVKHYVLEYPVSGEINSEVSDPKCVMEQVAAIYGKDALSVDRTDGLGMEFDNWRFNLRMSNTEPLIRLNVESRGDEQLMKTKTSELLSLIRNH
ncbi:MAG: phosphomannomutase [Deferribacterales bacterium]